MLLNVIPWSSYDQIAYAAECLRLITLLYFFAHYERMVFRVTRAEVVHLSDYNFLFCRVDE